jgi:UDPglucose--hexose-1-phosphate uridylyltransferase
MALLYDDITGEPRLVVPRRAKRPNATGADAPPRTGCPFCAGNEDETPRELERIDGHDASWLARSVLNLYPLVDGHEVLIATPRHATSLRELTPREFAVMVALWQRRHSAHTTAAAGDHYTHLFVNDGTTAGASMPHVHAQLLSIPHTRASDALVEHVHNRATCVLCSEAGFDVWRDEQYRLHVPKAPRIAGTMVLAPIAHDTDFASAHALELAEALALSLVALPDNDFNLWVVANQRAGAHWYVELVPRVGYPAGVELPLHLPVCIDDPAALAERAKDRIAAA